MSAALAAQADASSQSLGTMPDFSLGSLASGISMMTPARPPLGQTPRRVPSITSQTTAQSSAPLSTPSVVQDTPSSSHLRRNSSSRLMTLDDDLDDFLDTPGREKIFGDLGATPSAATPGPRSKRPRSSLAGGKGSTLTLREQEKHIGNLKNENFNLKLKVHFLEERLAALAPEQMDAALKQNIHLKIEVQQRGMELKKLKKLVLELQQALERTQRGTNSLQARDRELEERLEEREREIRELRRQRSVGREDEALVRELEERNEQLEEELGSVRDLLQDNNEEIERLRDVIERRANESFDEQGRTRRERLEELEVENHELATKLKEYADLLAQREDEKEDMADELEALTLQIEDLKERLAADAQERSESRAMFLEEREERQAVEEDLNSLRDKLAAANIELQQRDDDLEVKNTEIDDLIAEHRRIVEEVEDQWRGEVDEARAQVEELRDALAERETESKDLRINIAELEAQTEELHTKYDAAFEHMEREAEDKDTEIENANREIQQLGDQVWRLEEEGDALRKELSKIRDEEAVERDRLEALVAAYKDKLAMAKDEVHEKSETLDFIQQDIQSHRGRQEELAQHIEELVAQLQKEQSLREKLQQNMAQAENEHDAAIRREHRMLENKESALQSALADLARSESLLSQRESDLAVVQEALKTTESEHRRAGESHTTAKFSLQLEVDRLKRDVDRLEDELSRARRALDDRETRTRDRDSEMDRLHAENRDLAAQLAAQTQARLNISEKLEVLQASTKTSESDLSAARARVSELEQRLSKDQRSLLSAESQYRDQLTERNTLLLTIYQYMDKILGVDKTPKKSGQAETKPYTNFSVFHDNLISRLKQLSQIQFDFEKRCKDVESVHAEKLAEMRRQLDQRWKQLDKFETQVKLAIEAKATWRRKFASQGGELEATKQTNADLAAQMTSMKRTGGPDPMELRAAQTRAANAERRLTNAQNQLAASEERLAEQTKKYSAAESKWEARVKQYEAMLREEREKVKRTSQGGKERANDLDNQVKRLQKQLELEKQRSNQLGNVLETNKAAVASARTPAR